MSENDLSENLFLLRQKKVPGSISFTLLYFFFPPRWNGNFVRRYEHALFPSKEIKKDTSLLIDIVIRLLNLLLGVINSMGLTLKQCFFFPNPWNLSVFFLFLLVSQIQHNWLDSIYPFTTNLWWKWTFIRSFHSSVLRLREHSPSAERFIFPLVMLNPENID